VIQFTVHAGANAAEVTLSVARLLSKSRLRGPGALFTATVYAPDHKIHQRRRLQRQSLEQ
jgi:hypothetical protein